MDFSRITEFLYIGTHPTPQDYHTLRDVGVRLVINMRWERRPHRDPHDPPMPVLWLPTFDSPVFPIPIAMLYRGVSAALVTIQSGGAVYSHCAAGMHRSVALGVSILIALELPPHEAMELVKQHRTVADPTVWYIRRRIERFAQTWQTSQQLFKPPSGSSAA